MKREKNSKQEKKELVHLSIFVVGYGSRITKYELMFHCCQIQLIPFNNDIFLQEKKQTIGQDWSCI